MSLAISRNTPASRSQEAGLRFSSQTWASVTRDPERLEELFGTGAEGRGPPQAPRHRQETATAMPSHNPAERHRPATWGTARGPARPGPAGVEVAGRGATHAGARH